MKKILIFILVAFLLTFGATPAYAVPALPHAFYGSVTINGADAPAGSRISATVDEGDIVTIQNPVPIVEGSYGIDSPLLLVQGDGLSGVITFYVNDYEAVPSQTVTFEAGGGPTWVALSVTIPSTIGYSPSSFSFTATQGRANPPSQTLSISNAGVNPTAMDWSVTSDAAWLSLSPTGGSSGGEVNSVTVSVSISGMSAGSYSASITISAPGAANTAQTVAVSLAIAAPPPPAPAPPAGGVGPPPTPPPPPGTTDVKGEVSSEGVFEEQVTAPSDDELCTLTIPKNTVGLTEDLEPLDEITITTMTAEEQAELPTPTPDNIIVPEGMAIPEDAYIVSLVYDFGPPGATFEAPIDQPVTLTLNYDETLIPVDVSEENLVIVYWNETAEKWEALQNIVVDQVNNTISGELTHFTAFTILGLVLPPPPAPAAFSVTNLSVKPLEIQPKEAVTIAVSVANTGGTEGSYTVVLKINGVKEADKSISIAAGRSEVITFSVTREDAGSYSVVVDGLSSSFTVVVPAIAPPPPAPPPPAPPPPAPPPPAPPPPAPPVPAPAPAPAPPINWPVVGGIIAAVVVVALVVIFFWARRRA